MQTDDFYVYLYSIDGVPRYAGKGINDRAIEHLQAAFDLNTRRAEGRRIKTNLWHNALAKALRERRTIDFEMIIAGISEEVAWCVELDLIEFHGRVVNQTGPLLNVCEGANGWSSDDARLCALKAHQEPKFIQAHAEGMRRRWAKPEERKKHSILMSAWHLNSSSEFKMLQSVKASQRIVKLNASKEFQALAAQGRIGNCNAARKIS